MPMRKIASARCISLAVELRRMMWKRWSGIEKAAEQGNTDGQYNLGVAYENGCGVAKDEVEAVKWYREAAVQRHALARNILGVMYKDGRGVAKDEVEAVKWFLLGGGQGEFWSNQETTSIEDDLTAAQAEG